MVDLLVETEHAPEFVRLLAGPPTSTRASTLDVGSGSGRLLVDMARHGFTRLLGIDPYLEKSRTIGCVPARAENGRRLSGAFDLVILKDTFEHLGGPRRVLDAVRRLLAPSGTVVIRTPVADSSASRSYTVRIGSSWTHPDTW